MKTYNIKNIHQFTNVEHGINSVTTESIYVHVKKNISLECAKIKIID